MNIVLKILGAVIQNCLVDRGPRICVTLLLAHLVCALKNGSIYKMTVYCCVVFINSRVNAGCSLSAILQFYVYCMCLC